MLKLYEGHEEEMEDMLVIVIQQITRFFRRETSDSPAGTTPLTNVSMKVGKFIYQYMDREPVSWRDELRLGDLFIEAFYNCGFVNIDYPARRDSCHTVKAAEKWAKLSYIPDPCFDIALAATYTEKPADITSQVNSGKPVLKNGGEIDVDSPFTRSINKLQQTGWFINNKVFDALLKAEGFVSTKVDKNEARNLKRLSCLLYTSPSPRDS